MDASFATTLSRSLPSCWFGAIVLLAAAVSGCGREGEPGTTGPGGAKTDLATASQEAILAQITGRTFELVDWEGGPDLASLAHLMRRPVDIHFLEDGRFAAQGPVNRLMGSLAAADDGYLAIDKRIASTMMAGPEILMELERQLIDALASVREIVLDNKHLALVTPEGTAIHFEETPTAAERPASSAPDPRP